MRRALLAALLALAATNVGAVALADPIIQPLRCQIGDRTGIYVGGKCSGPY